MYASRTRVALTTAADGSATVVTPPVTGRIAQIVYTKPAAGGFDNGSTITVTNNVTGETIWTESSVNASAVRAPRQPTHSTAGAAALYVAAGTAVNDLIAVGGDELKIVIASGGNAKNATFDFVLA